MRDIVSEVGTFDTGLSDLPVIKTTQTSAAIPLAGYDGICFDILADNWTDGTITPVIQYTNDDGTGSPNSGSWTAVPATDLILWKATSASDRTPVKANDTNGNPTGNSQPAAISSAATAINQRVGYIGGIAGVSDYLRIVSTISGSPSTGMGYDVHVLRGRPRVLPAKV